MTKQDIRIIFLGNPEFARYHLEKIVENGYNVVAVISAADKPAGRGMEMRATPVTQYARELGIDCLQPKNLKNSDFIKQLRSYNADVQVVIAFRMLPVVVWDMPTMGTYNLHASLLPQYRGAAPINWAIINGETETGVTTFKLKHEIDTGNLVVQEKCPIAQDDTAGTLHDKLKVLGAEAMLTTLHLLTEGNYKEFEQSQEDGLKPAPKIYTETCEIKWDQKGQDILNFVRGMNPYPTAFCNLENKKMKVFSVEFSPGPTDESGELATDGRNYLAFRCNDGWIFLLDVQLQGKKRMDVKSFLNGYKTEAIGPALL